MDAEEVLLDVEVLVVVVDDDESEVDKESDREVEDDPLAVVFGGDDQLESNRLERDGAGE